jgi:hypothetical protein
MGSGTRNAIERRLELLQDQWTEFALDPKARLLRWVVTADELCMVEALWAKESDERAAETPDLFLRLQTPFEDPDLHGLALRREFLEALAKAQEALGDEGRGPRWSCPVPLSGAPDVQTLVAALEAFRAAHASDEAVVGVWLDAARIGDPEAYVRWLQRLAQAAGAGCRFVILEDSRHSTLASLALLEPGRVHTAVADLDVPAALEELSQQAGLETPGGQYRHLLSQLGAAAKSEDLDRATALADRASSLASEQGWPTLAATAHLALAGVLAATRPEEALTRCGLAEALAGKAQEGGDAQGPAVRLHARLMRGSLLMATGAFGEAATWYQQTVPFAEAAKDAPAALDCWRLASYGHEQNGAHIEAWEAGLVGFRGGRKLEVERRKSSTLPHLAEALMRLTRQRALKCHATAMEEQVIATLGRDWRPSR